MSEKCSDISQNVTKLSYPGENLGFTTEIDGRENKEDFVNFPFDHMYACSSDNSDLNSERQAGESEVRHLKDLLLLHLDLIQQQSDEIVNKDKHIAQLRQENEMLKHRLERMERRSTLQQSNNKNNNLHNNNNSSSSICTSLDTFEAMTHDNSGFCTDTEDSKDNFRVMGLCSEEIEYKPIVLNLNPHNTDPESGGIVMGPSGTCFENRDHQTNLDIDTMSSSAISVTKEDIKLEISKLESFPDSSLMRHSVENTMLDEHPDNGSFKEARQFTLRPNNRRKRLCSSSSLLSNNESLTSTSDVKRRKGSLKRLSILTTDTPYVMQTGILNTSSGDDSCEPLDINSSTKLEVPRWRVKLYTSCYTMEGTENLDDDVYNRRHFRLENDERRRKRWDVQRIREQRNVERLKQRQERHGLKSDEQTNEPLETFWPSLEDVRYIEVTDELPISAFGTPIPKLSPCEFRLPWLNGTVSPKKPQSKKSTARRKMQKR